MGNDRSEGDLRGIVVPDPRISLANLTAKDHAVVPSVYTQAGAFTGPAVPDQKTDLKLRTSGTQSADGDLEILTKRSGSAAHEGAGHVWRDLAALDKVTEYKGWDAPPIVTAWESLLYTTVASGADIRPHVIRLLSGKLLCTYSMSTIGVVLTKRYDPADSSWTSVNLSPTGAGTGYVTTAATLIQLSSGRVICYVLSTDQTQVDAYYSDDDGTNWRIGGYRVLDIGVGEDAITDMRVSFSPESRELLLLIAWANSVTGSSTATQYASADLGSTFTQVLADWEVATTLDVLTFDIVPTDGGGFVVAFVETATTVRRSLLGSAFTSLASVTPDTILPGGGGGADVAIWADESGVMWAAMGRDGAGFRSLDQGDTWTKSAFCQEQTNLHTGVQTAYLGKFSVALIAGRAAMVSRWVAAGSAYDPMSVGVVWRGGYSTHTVPSGAEITNQDFQDVNYIAWGDSFGLLNAHGGGFWIPIEEPDSADWVLGNGGVSSQALVAPGEFEISTNAGGFRDYERDLAADTALEAGFVEFSVELDAGSGSLVAEEITMLVEIGNSTWRYRVQVRCSDAGYQLYDDVANADVGAAVAFDLTTRAHIRIAIDADNGAGGDIGNIRVWHCRPGHIRTWTVGPTSSTLNDEGVGGTPTIKWGHTAAGAGANKSRWSLVGYCFWPGKFAGTQTDSLASSWSNPTDLHPKSFSPIPELIHDGVWLQALSGPSWLGETQRIKAAYQYPISAILPGSSPSPSRGWRSVADNSNMEITFDLERDPAFTDSFFEASSLGGFLVNSNLKEVKVRGWNGAGWDDILTITSSIGYAAINFTRKGRLIYRDLAAGNPTAERWSPEMMHAGDTIEIDGDMRRIASNSGGGYRANTRLARLKLDTALLDGTESASGAMTIYRRNFGAVVHNLSAFYRYVQLYIGAQVTADGDYRIGQMAVGPVSVFGLQYGNSWAMEDVNNTELNTRDSGVRSSRVRGVRRRSFDLSWASQPQDTTRMWDSEPAPDYVTGVAGGDPIASLADTVYQVLGLTDRTNGPNSPIIYIGQMVRGAGSQHLTLDPLWLYCRMTSMSPGADHIIGDEGSTPAFRGPRVRVEEEV